MKRSTKLVGIVLLAILMLAYANPVADAGRVGGSWSTITRVPGGTSVFFDIPFAAGGQASVSIVGDGVSALQLLMYDSDGHTSVASGTLGRLTVAMNVYRAGVFRVEVRNINVYQACNVTLTTN